MSQNYGIFVLLLPDIISQGSYHNDCHVVQMLNVVSQELSGAHRGDTNPIVNAI